MRRVLVSPVALFLVIGVLTVVGIVLGTQHLADQAAKDEAVSEAQATTQVIGRSVAQPDILAQRDILTARPGAIDRFDQSVRSRLLVGDVRRVIIWRADGTIVYSSYTPLITLRLHLDAARRATLASGQPGSEISGGGVGESVDRAKGEAGGPDGRVQTFTRIHGPHGEPLLFEAHYPMGQIEVRGEEIFSSFRLITIGPSLLLIVIVTLMLSLLTRRLTSAGHERERLLHAAIDASDAERRRIARDLHDGVVQDLAGTAFSLSALARDSQTPADSRSTLRQASSSLRDGLKALRSLLAEIHPPDLQPDGLAAALSDLTAPAATADIQASVAVSGAEHLSTTQTAVLWRVAQEAVRNAIRHSGASTLAVTVHGDAKQVTLEVVDDGIGFDPEGPREHGRFGLRGLRSLARDSNGRVEVRSSPGEGTTVHMEVDVR
ncbi:MAG: sensor histidine kinase [Nocardioides sp.]